MSSAPANIPLPEIMQFTVGSEVGFRGSLPSALPSVPAPNAGTVVRKRNLLMVEIMDPATGMPVMALLNNRKWTTNQIEQPRADALEQWNLINLTADTHPIHLHLVQFRLRDRQPIDAAAYLQQVFGTDMLTPADIGRGAMPYPAPWDDTTGPAVRPSPVEAGWKDTIQAHPGMVTRIIVPFGRGAAPSVPFGARNRFTGDYVWHCHILDHEDNEMMLPFRVLG